MDAAKWQVVKLVFNSALECPAAELGAFLDNTCGADAELRGEVNRLLIEHLNVGDFLSEPLRLHHGFGVITPSGPTSSAPVSLGTTRFELRTRLGSGGFGDVFEAFDHERKSAVALKCLRRGPDQLYRFKREFRALADIRHPNLIQVYELFSGNAPPFFTMELLTGQDFGAYLRGLRRAAAETGSVAYAELRPYLRQLFTGVIALHEAELLHRDIKPSNIFITSEGRVVLLDFGLVTHLVGDAAATTLAVAGTPHYLAPEQLAGEPLSEATDWYAVGVVLFEALTGRTPFDGSIVDVFSQKRTNDAPAASGLAPDVPRDLDVLCQWLLRREPSARPTGAQALHALYDAGRMAVRGSGMPIRIAKVFVSREEHLETLRTAFRDVEGGSAVCLHVRGLSGVGKTALIRNFLDQLRRERPDCAVLTGRCYESEAAAQKGLDELVDHLASFLRGAPAAESLMPRHFGLLARLFPVLQQFHAAARAVPNIPDPREQRHRAFGCLRECLGRISERSPLVVWIDDLQWADFNTIRLLNDLVQAPDPASFLVLLSYRDNDLKTNPLLQSLSLQDRAEPPSIRVLEVKNLLDHQARELATLLLHQASPAADTEGVIAAIARESSGNPYFIAELVRYGSAFSDARGLSAGAFGIDHVIKRRVGLLPDPAARLLELIAVAGRPLSSDVCRMAAALGDTFLEASTVLRREHFIRTDVSVEGEKFDLYHDQIRESITGYLSLEATKVYHGLLAGALEETGSTDFEQLSLHCEAAGHGDKAIRYARHAAERAVEALAFDRAARLFRRILDNSRLESGERQHIVERLAEALSDGGRGKEAADAFLDASQGHDSARALALRIRACEQYLRSGHVDTGMSLSRVLLQEVGIRYPRTNWAVLASLVWSRFQLGLRMPLIRAETRTAPTLQQQTRLDVFWTVTVGMSMVDVLRSAAFQARYTLLALRTGDPSQVARGLAAELAGGSIDGTRSTKRTDALFSAAMRLAVARNDARAIGFATSMRGVVSWFEGDWQDCHDRSAAASTIFREKCSGIAWELTTANTFALSSLVFLGRWREHAHAIPGLILQAEERGDRFGAASLPLLAYAYMNDLAQDQPGRARTRIREALAAWPDDDFHLQHCDALVGQLEALLYEGDAQAAYDTLKQEWNRLKTSNLLEIRLYRILFTALRSRAALGLAAADGNSSAHSHRMLKTAKNGASSLSKEKLRWGLAFGSLLEAGIASVERDVDSATRYLQAASDTFDATGMGHYAAVAQVRITQLGAKPERPADALPDWMKNEGISNPLRLADMFAPGIWHA